MASNTPTTTNPPQHHTYLYKILSTNPSDPSMPLVPGPNNTLHLPPGTTLPPTPLDTSSTYIHLSTSTQIPGTLSRFFASPTDQHSQILLLKCPREAFSSSTEVDVLRWERPDGSPGPEGEGDVFPHVYFPDGRLGLRAGEVVEVRVLESLVGEEGWGGALAGLGGAWLV